jgi:hypothetical protein
MPFIGLGSRRVVSALDQTGLNQGNYTAAFTPAVLIINVPYYELYKMIVENVPLGFSATCVIDNKHFSFTLPNQGSEWDPSQPMPMIPTNELDLLWNIPVPNASIPVVTAWFRFDPSIPANQRYGTQYGR